MTIKVLLVEDHTMIRMGTALVIEKTEGIELVAQAEDGEKGVNAAGETSFSVLYCVIILSRRSISPY